MSDERLDVYLSRIGQVAGDAIEFIQDMDRERFISDLRTQRAVVMCLMIIGESVTQVIERYPDFVAEHPNVPWQNIRGMRNRIAHGYFDLDLGTVWATVSDALPNLVRSLPEAGNASESD